MTTKEKLAYIQEAEELNDERIEHFVMLKKLLSREPICKRSDPRYQLKVAAKYWFGRFKECFPEYFILMISGIVSMFVFPLLAVIIWG